MNRVKMLSLVAVLSLVLPAFPGRPVSAQDARPAPPREADPVAALTAEFRALRAELAAASAATMRLQLLVARLQAQEQRVLYFDRLRGEAATRRLNAEQGRDDLARQLGQFTGAETARLEPEERRQVQIRTTELKNELARQERMFQQTQIEENDAANAVAQEQGRWNDFNARLDELERSLSQR